MSVITSSDSYKFCHFRMLPKGTEVVYSYFESRTGALFSETTFFGLQYLLKKHFVGKVVTQDKIEEAAAIAKAHFGDDTFFNRAGWEHILNHHDGKLPVVIKAVAEGSSIPTSNVLMTIENTDEKCAWLTNYLETLLTHVWYSSTVATKSRCTKKIINSYLDITSDNKFSLPFALHDFGFRGVSSLESAAIGDAGHLICFAGSDTVPGIILLRDYYHGELNEIAFSVAASEHSISSAEGEDGENEYIVRLLREFPNGILSLVADTYNIERFIDEYIRNNKQNILDRWINGKGQLNRVVIRPDSPRFVGEQPANQVLWILSKLWDIFGGSINQKGYKTLHPAVGVLWGDGLSTEEIEEIYRWAANHKFDVSSIVCGQGGGLLQKVNRDTQRFAFKCSAQKRNGEWLDIQKKPMDVSKASKKGKLALININGTLMTVSANTLRTSEEDLLIPVFKNGVLLKDYTLKEVRNNAKL